MEMKWTPEQQKVIELRDRNILVSAAAGSGKTAVLVERILGKLTRKDHPIDIDQLLIVTFTRAAAGEMRERLTEAVENYLEQDPENEHLQRQQTLIHNAQITTIDGFCSYVIRNYFHTIDLDPGFRTANEGEIKLLEQDVAKEVLESSYQERTESFDRFVESFATGKSDEVLTELILRMYEFAMSNPWPLEWLDSCTKAYEIRTKEELVSCIWMKKLWEDAGHLLDQITYLQERCKEVIYSSGGPYMYGEALEQDLLFRRDLEEAFATQDFDGCRVLLDSWKPKALSRKKDDSVQEDKRELAKNLRDQAKDAVKKLRENYFYETTEEVLEELELCREPVQELIRLTRQFIETFSEKKRQKNIVDFTDMEHFALEILVKKEDGEIRYTQAADEFSDRIEEILIDEYQDSNYVQELILTSISRTDPPNLFMVGDVKQSIYRFRLARPELFMEKYETYTKEESEHQKIELHQNFRSRKSVLDSVNFFFYQLMHKAVGNVEYDKDAALYPGLVYEPCDTHPTGGATELMLLDLEDVTEDSDDDVKPENEDTQAVYSSREWEAAMIAEKIREITDPESGLYIWDKEQKTYRLTEYRDIAILLRTVSGWAEELISVLLSKGISASADTGSGYFSALEVQTILNLLEIIDNPLQDIPLAAVMHSPIGHFSSEELAIIRAEEPPSQCKHLYDAATSFAQKYSAPADAKNKEGYHELAGRLRIFFNKLETYRRKSRYLLLRELLVYVLEDSGDYEFISAMPGAATRKANLDMLLERAGAFEKTSYQGVFQFVRYINRLKKYSVDYASAQELAQNQVRVMSIHKSKGLEFPVCFVAGLGKSFNKQDVNASMLFSVDYGIATDAIDPTLRTKDSTVMKQAMRSQLMIENLGEELRVLYVAMTRAREKLYLTGAKDHLFDYLEKKIHETDKTARELSYSQLTMAGSFLDWITAAACKHKSFKAIYEQLGINVPFDGVCYKDESPLSVLLVTKSSLSMQTSLWRAEEAMKRTALENWKNETTDETSKNLIESRFLVRYDDSPLSKLQAAFTVSELKARHEEEAFAASGSDVREPAAQLIKQEPELQDQKLLPDEELLPEFLQQKDKMSGAARGTLYHWLFEHFDFTGDLRAQLSSFMQQELISTEERKRIRIADFDCFVQTPLGKKVKQAQEEGTYHREMPFILGVPAKEMIENDKKLSEKDENEYVSVQGVIDAWIDGEDYITLIDFKTDKKPEDMTDEEFKELLKKRYQVQLSYYKRALMQMTKRPVKEACIYAVSIGQTIFC